VFLTDGMAQAFQRQYGDVTFRVATNAHFVAEEAARPAAPRREGQIRLGHLSNLCADKGFFAVADTFDAVRKAGIDATLALAGPILEPVVADRLAFYRDIDGFLFPTAWRQEAAPLVIYEALAAGCPVLTTDRGLIAEFVPAVGGAVCPRGADFVSFAVEYLRTHPWDQGARDRRADEIKDWIRAECARSAAQYQAILAQLASPPVSW
jgi:glycosyltransferase involved in cell wall biosynthesis